VEWNWTALWPVEADAGRIEQIITNLVVNARDAMPQGGSLTIRTANIAAAHLPPDMPSPASGLAACLSIRDSGVGMDDRVLAHCFEPFFTTKEAGKGTGMGLSVVYGVLQQHQGSAAIESQVGQGTTIHCTCPQLCRR
jgi:signal transduction histidine kinase